MDKDEKIDRLLKHVSKEGLHFATVYTRAIGKFTYDNDEDVWQMLDVMREKDLVKFIMLGSKEVVLTSFGKMFLMLVAGLSTTEKRKPQPPSHRQ